jgi:predicted TIM-barrel fold metal-dependent hydrolase
VADYHARTAGLDVTGGAVVTGSFQGNDALIAALAELGPGFVGVATLRSDTPDDEIHRLHVAGVRAVRFNLRRGGTLDTRLADRVHALVGWHAEVYTDDLAAVERQLRTLPRLVIDHLGMNERSLPALLRLVERHGAMVKASGFGRVELDVAATIRRIDPTALMFGTDLPGTRARRPFEPADLELVRRLSPRALEENARAWYQDVLAK